METPNNPEIQYPARGIQLLKKGDVLDKLPDNEAGIDFLFGPEYPTGSIGRVQLQLARDQDPSEKDNRKIYRFKDGKIDITDRNSAEYDGYSLQVNVRGSNIPEGYRVTCNVWVPGQFLITSDGVSADELNEFNYEFHIWKVNVDEGMGFVLPNDPSLLHQLLTSFETINEAGGEVN